jgi:NAD-dependent SIR2 family protein deacetylase
MKDILKIKRIINDADAIVIGAGAGLSTSAGINYGTKNFKENFPELVKKYNMTDMYTSSFYEFKTEEERWSYLAKHINYLYNVDAKEVYKNLYELVKDKNYFVITTNVDGQFLKAGFDKEKVFETQGSLSKMQCSKACHNKLYDDLKLVSEMLKEDKDCKIPSRLVPHCPRCGEEMDINLRKDEYFVEDNAWHKLSNNYNSFINDNKDKNVVFLELGVGFNTPGIIRFPFEEMTLNFKGAYLIRANDKYTDTVFELKDKAILIKEDCGKVINGLINRK